MDSLLMTLKVASFSTCAAFVSGVLAAFFLNRTALPGKRVIEALLTLPMVLPPTVLGYYLIVVFGRQGFLGHWLNEVFGVTLMFTWQGAVLAAALVSFPLVFKSAGAAFDDVDDHLENAARTLGITEVGIFFKVSLPLAWRGILAGTFLAFARAMGEFGATLMIAGNLPGRTQTVPMAVYDAVQAGNDQLAGMLVLIVSIAAMSILYISGRLLTQTDN